MKLIHFLCLLVTIGMTSHEDQGFVRLVRRVGEDVVLPCSLGPENSIEQALFDWTKDGQYVVQYNAEFYHSEEPQFEGRVSNFSDQLKNGNASIRIRNLRLSDSGTYSCIFQRPQHRTFHVELVVGIFAEPRVTALEITEDQTLLQCEVHGAIPKPQISWIDSDENVLPAEEKLEDSDGLHYPSTLMLQTIVTKTGIFRCRATQKELNFTTEAPISVHIFSDETVTGSDGGLLGVTIVCWILLILGLVVVGIYCWCRRRAVSAEMLKAIISRKAKRPAVAERHDSRDSSPHPSHPPAKPEETRELNPEVEPEPEAEPDEDVRIYVDELQ